ncbi:MAG: universal stress protein [Bacteroidetes bacterium]|nr:MAG: universal stress protein [Bacteroidota bacterium]
MKNMLIPTDFSACASYAVEAGLEMAKRYQSKVFLFHNADIPNNWSALSAKEKDHIPEAYQSWKNAEVLLTDIQSKNQEIDIDIIIAGGDLVKNIEQITKEKHIGLIVMGSQGAGKSDPNFFGSNTQLVVRQVKVPVLIIKSRLKDFYFEKVVFASGFDEADKEAFLKFKDFVKHFIPEIHLVSIQSLFKYGVPYIVQKEAMESFEKLCSPLVCKIHISKHTTIEKGIRSLADEIGAELIGISNHYRHPLRRLLTGSTVEALVNYSGIPVLTIDYGEKGKKDA